jgi:hypothetical protein
MPQFFDVGTARSAGYNDAEIADELARVHGFDSAGARAAGYQDSDIIEALYEKAVPVKKDVLHQVVDVLKGTGANLAAGVEESVVASPLEFLARQVDRIPHDPTDESGVSRILRGGARAARQGADMWRKEAEEAGQSPESLAGEVYRGIGGAPAGVAKFVTNIPGAVVDYADTRQQRDLRRGGADDNPLLGVAKAAAERYAIGKVFHGIEGSKLSAAQKSLAMTGVMTGQAAVEPGATPESITAAALTGAVLSPPGGSGKADVIRARLIAGGVRPEVAADLANRAETIGASMPGNLDVGSDYDRRVKAEAEQEFQGAIDHDWYAAEGDLANEIGAGRSRDTKVKEQNQGVPVGAPETHFTGRDVAYFDRLEQGRAELADQIGRAIEEGRIDQARELARTPDFSKLPPAPLDGKAPSVGAADNRPFVPEEAGPLKPSLATGANRISTETPKAGASLGQFGAKDYLVRRWAEEGLSPEEVRRRVSLVYGDPAAEGLPESRVPRPDHDNLETAAVTAADSLDLQNQAPEVKPVVKGTPAEIGELIRGGKTPEDRVLFSGKGSAYIIDPEAVRRIYGVPRDEAIRNAKRDLLSGGDAEGKLLGYPSREGVAPKETIDVAVTKKGEVITDLSKMREEAAAGNIAWAAEGAPDSAREHADRVAHAITGRDGADPDLRDWHLNTPERQRDYELLKGIERQTHDWQHENVVREGHQGNRKWSNKYNLFPWMEAFPRDINPEHLRAAVRKEMDGKPLTEMQRALVDRAMEVEKESLRSGIDAEHQSEHQERAAAREIADEREAMGSPGGGDTSFDFGANEEAPADKEGSAFDPAKLYSGVPVDEVWRQGKRAGKAFWEQDLAPAVQGLADALTRIRKSINPRTGVPSDALDAIMGMKGDRDKAEFFLEATGRHVEKMFNGMSREGQVRFVDMKKRGDLRSMSPELRAAAELMDTVQDASYREVMKYKPSASWKENHFRVLWKEVPGAAKKRGFMGIRKTSLEGSKGFLEKSTLDDMSQGIEAGGVPIDYNPWRMFLLAEADKQQFITANRMWAGMKDLGYVKFIRNGGAVPEGFTRLDDRIAKVYFPVENRTEVYTAKPTDGYWKPKPHGDVFKVESETHTEKVGVAQGGEYFVHEGPARILNNFLSRDMIREVPAGRGLVYLKNVTTAVELGFSGFHFMFEMAEGTSSSMGLGLQKIANRGFRGDMVGMKDGIKDILTSPFAGKQTFTLGRQTLRYVTDENFRDTPEGKALLRQFPNIDRLMDLAFKGGLQMKMHKDYVNSSVRTFKDSLESGNLPGAALRAMPAAAETVMKPLFEHFIPQLKLGMFMREMSNELEQRAGQMASGEVSAETLASRTVDFIEDRFGEMNFDNLFWDRTFKTTMQMLFRSVTWKLGNLRGIGDAIPEQGREVLRAMEAGRTPMLTPKLAWTLGVVATHVAMATVTMKALTGDWPDETLDFIFPRSSRRDKEARVSMYTYVKEGVSLYHSSKEGRFFIPTEYLRASLAGMWGRIGDVWANRDYYGTEIYSEGDSTAAKVGKSIGHAMPLPFSVSSARKMLDNGEPAWKALVTSAIGANKAPSWIERTEAENLAFALANRGERASQPQDHSDRKRLVGRFAGDIREALANNEGLDSVAKEITSRVNAGQLSQNDVKTILARVQKEPMERTFQRLSMSEALRVWEVATPEEKKSLTPALTTKARRFITGASGNEIEGIRGGIMKALEEAAKMRGGK